MIRALRERLAASAHAAVGVFDNRESHRKRSYRRQTVDPLHFPRSGERSYVKVALSG
jgi:hypothetical protein